MRNYNQENDWKWVAGSVLFVGVAVGAAFLVNGHTVSREENLLSKKSIPSKMRIPHDGEGFFFGKVSSCEACAKECSAPPFCGKPIDEDGNILIIGSPGSGKTTGHIYPTMKTWKGNIVTLDVKGDMEAAQKSIHKEDGKKLYVFAPFGKGEGTCTFDPFFLMKMDPANAAGHACDIAEALVPISASDRDPVWREAAQNILAGALLYYFHCGKSFIEAVETMSTQTVLGLIACIMGSGCKQEKSFVSQFQGVSSKTAASIGMNLTKLSRFLLNPEVIGSLTPDSARPMLGWHELNSDQKPFDVIIDVHGVALSQCAPLVRLMLTQLVKTLSLREEKNYKKTSVPPVLICIDEFPQLERMPAMISALTTLRSKDVTIALCVQSLASLDATYGHDEAKAIFDACSYKVIRRVSDVESQEYISKAIGSTDVVTGSPALSFSFPMGIGASMSYTRKQRPLVYPEELGRLKNPILITPYGACEVLSGKEYPQAHREALRAPHSNVWPEVKDGNAVPKELSTPALDDAHELTSVHLGFPQEKAVSWQGDKDSELQTKMDDICAFCVKPRSAKEIMEHCNLKARPYFHVKFLAPLLEQGRLRMMHPENPKHPQQRYCTVEGTVKTPC